MSSEVPSVSEAVSPPQPLDPPGAVEANCSVPLDESLWSRLQAAGVTIPAEIIDKLAELDLELSEGKLERGELDTQGGVRWM